MGFKGKDARIESNNFLSGSDVPKAIGRSTSNHQENGWNSEPDGR